MNITMDIIQVRRYIPEGMLKPVVEIMNSDGEYYMTHYNVDKKVVLGVQQVEVCKTINCLGIQTFINQ